MKKTTKKLIAFLLTLVMLLSVAPMGAFAAEEEPVQFAFDADDLNKLFSFPVYQSGANTTGNVIRPLCSFTAPVAGTYRFTVSSPKDSDSYHFRLESDKEITNGEVYLEAGEVFKFRPSVANWFGNEFYSTRLKIEEKTCTDADNNNICDVCGSFCTGKVGKDGSFPVTGEIQLGELVHIGHTVIPPSGSSVYAKIAFTPPADGEYYISAGATNIWLHSNEDLTGFIGYDELLENYEFSTAGISYKYTLTGGETYYILVELGMYINCCSRDLTVVTHDLCSDLNHDDFCDADQSFLGESIIPGESFDVLMDYEWSSSTTSWAVFTPEEDGLYRFTTPYFDSNGGSLGNVAFSLIHSQEATR